MFNRLGLPGTLAALVLVACVVAALFQKSVVAMVVAVPAAIYVGLRLFRPTGA